MSNTDISNQESALCAAVDAAFEDEQVPWLKNLIEQPSHTLAREDVEAAAAIIELRAKRIGLRCEHVPDADGVFADHRVYSGPGTADGETALALVGHCDTVYPVSQGFLTFRRDPPDADQVRGPGTLDMKSGLSCILFGLEALARVSPEAFSRLKVRFICNTDEEVGSPNSRILFERLAPQTSNALVFEGGRDGDQIITARKGTGSFTLTATGKSAHAGNDHAEGVNAIHVLSLIVPQVEALTDYDRGTTVNVGVIEGGTSKNTVPEKSWCVIDVRTTNMAETRRVEMALKTLAERPLAGIDSVPSRLTNAIVRLEGGMRRTPMEATPESQQLREHYEVIAQRQGLGMGEAPLQGGGSDANLLAALGVPTIDGLGPYGKGFHSPQEWSSLDSLRKRTKALACFLCASSQT